MMVISGVGTQDNSQFFVHTGYSLGLFFQQCMVQFPLISFTGGIGGGRFYHTIKRCFLVSGVKRCVECWDVCGNAGVLLELDTVILVLQISHVSIILILD